MMKRRIWMAYGLAAVILLAGCGGGTEPAKEASAPAPGAAAPAVDPATAAAITGKVMFSGTPPVMRPISMDATPACARQHSTVQRSEEVVVNSDGSLKYVLVYVKAGLPDVQWPTPATAVKLDQHTCVYKPHVISVMTNQDIEITNSDPTNHNIHPIPFVNREWNESQAPGAEAKIKQFAREEIGLVVKCNVHPWMQAYVHVLSHPFHAVTGDDGSFTLKGLPPGEYTLEAWHERFGTQEMKVKVGPSETGKAEFSFKS